MNNRIAWVALVVGFVSMAAAAATASDAELELGSKVRVYLPKGEQFKGLDAARRRLTGELVAINGDVLTIERDGKRVSVSREVMARLEVSRGFRSDGDRFVSGTGKGLLIGAGIGTFLGLMSMAGDHCSHSCSISSDAPLVGAAVVLGGAGGVIGGISGWLSSGDRWEVVSPARSQLSLQMGPVRRGAAVSMRYAF
jgi:hypothetical protein